MKSYCHPTGERGKGAVLDVGLSCPHSCLFCYYKEYNGSTDFQALRKGKFRSTDSLLEILSHFSVNGYRHFDITGGEPTLHPDIVKIVHRGCTELKLAGRVITLGQFLDKKYLAKRLLIDALLDAGLTDILFSFHAADETQFHQFTRGSLIKLENAMAYLDRKDFQYSTNTVVFKGNSINLQDIAGRIVHHGVYIHNFILFNAYHGWRDAPRTNEIQASYSEIRPSLEKSVQILDQAGIAVNIRYAPYCVVKGLEKHIVGLAGVFYDPFEWRNRACNYERPPEFCAEPVSIEHTYALRREEKTLESGWQIIATRGDNLKVFPETCCFCAAIEYCDGLSPAYLETHGDGELSPYDSFAIAGSLPIARHEYEAPFHVKTRAMEDMREIISRTKS